MSITHRSCTSLCNRSSNITREQNYHRLVSVSKKKSRKPRWGQLRHWFWSSGVAVCSLVIAQHNWKSKLCHTCRKKRLHPIALSTCHSCNLYTYIQFSFDLSDMMRCPHGERSHTEKRPKYMDERRCGWESEYCSRSKVCSHWLRQQTHRSTVLVLNLY